MKKLVLSTLLSIIAITAINAQQIKGPSIKFEKEVHDYGTIKNGADGKCEFTFTNDGTEPLKITNCRASCGCTIPSWPRTEILPGKTEVIKVKYDTKRTGPIRKTITITSNAVNTPRKTISIKGTIKPPVAAATAKAVATPVKPAPPVKTVPAVRPAKPAVKKPMVPKTPAKNVVKVKKRRWFQFWKKKN